VRCKRQRGIVAVHISAPNTKHDCSIFEISSALSLRLLRCYKQVRLQLCQTLHGCSPVTRYWVRSVPDNLGIRTLKSSSAPSNQHLVATSLKLTSSTISSLKSAQAKDSSKPIRRPQSLIGIETLHGPVLLRSRSGEHLRSRSSDASAEARETPSPGLIDWPSYRPSFARRMSFGA
jgi:hypothetical protein